MTLLDGDYTHLSVAYHRSAGPARERLEDVFACHLELARRRSARTATVRVYRDGIGPAVQIVNDDMPLLVESVLATVRRVGATVTEVLHPIFDVDRDDDGRLRSATAHEHDHNGPDPHTVRESWMHLQLGVDTPADRVELLTTALPPLLDELRRIHDDTPAIEAAATAPAHTPAAGPDLPDGLAAADSARLLTWLADGHFTWLGYARYECPDDGVFRVAGSELGLLRDDRLRLPQLGSDPDPLLLARGIAPDSLHGYVDPYFVGLRERAPDGRVTAVRLFVGMFTVTALHAGILDIPVIERRARTVIEWSGFDPNSFSGKEMLEVLESLPRVELFSATAQQLFETASAVLNLGLRHQVRLFLREDSRSHVVSSLVYLPRDRYNADVRLRMRAILAAEFDTDDIGYSVRVTESDLANLYFTVRRGEGHNPADTSEANRRRIQELLVAATRTWTDLLVQQAVLAHDVDPARARLYGEAFGEAYRQDFTPAEALGDVARLERLTDGRIDVRLYRRADAAPHEWRFALYVAGGEVSLSRVMPVLRSLGVEVIDERPHQLRLSDESPRWLYDFGLHTAEGALGSGTDPEADAGRASERFAEAFVAMWENRLEIGSLNQLVLRAGLGWREVSMLRGYARYLQQAQFPYSLGTLSRVLLAHPETATVLARLFAARFDPDAADAAAAADFQARLERQIDAVPSLDADRILRALLSLVTATLRTNYYLVDDAGKPPECLSFKFAPGRIAELPEPKPLFEIFVHSPRVEGVHLRFGAVARGGLRWSDRHEDFRTEILGLVKAQAVKNAVIVPVGAKGGFVVRNPPAPSGNPDADRAAVQAEGIACYQLFISGLLDVTDNLDPSGATIPPARVVRHDGDDSYLVVAADKGTAAFSDIANEVAARYRFWLGDAFASGGSVGYDHKAMAITAKGAWVSVQRHFREMNIDTQTTDFTVVGIGDMSGDVFGNGMLLSRHIRLVAAFDHRHIFLDPNPDPDVSFTERARLSTLPRSSWADYDPALIGEGGGVYQRTAKSIPISARARVALGLPDEVESLSPPHLVRAILTAPVDLLWNGGIGTYIKASTETNADVGDKSNDAVRVDAATLRVKVVGEGGNLGSTMLGRIEFARRGGRINTDALDNSAGVDCSDHEVNIKILLKRAIVAGELDLAERDTLLASMTDEVAELVLRDNVSQNFLMGVSRAHAADAAGVHRRLIDHLVRRHGVDRDLETLPSDTEMTRRMAEGRGLTSPELATLLAHVKLALKAELLASDLPDHSAFFGLLSTYFPAPLRTRFDAAIRSHPLRRAIVATILVNEMVDHAGIDYAFRLAEEAGASVTDAVRAFTAATAIFGLRELWHRIRAEDMPTAVRDELEIETRRTLDRASRWLLTNRPQPIAIGADISRYAIAAHSLSDQVPAWLRGYHVTDLVERSRAVIDRGAPPELAVEVFRLIHLFPLLDILDTADIADRNPDEVGPLYYALNDHLKIEWLLTAVHHLEHNDRWHSLARLALRDDMYSSLRSLTLAVLNTTDPDETAVEKIAYWESTNQSRLDRARGVLTEVLTTTSNDLAALSVAARQVRSMVPDGR